MSDPSADPVVKLALAVEKCLIGLAAAVGEFRDSCIDELRTSEPATVLDRSVAVKPEVAVPEWLTNDEAADYIGVAPQTLRQWNSRGTCGKSTDGKAKKPPKSYKRGGKIGYKLSDLARWLENSVTD